MNRPKSLNAITVEDYDAFANVLRDIDRRDDVLITVWQATGKWFCAGTNVKGARPFVSGSLRNSFLNNVAHTTTDCGQAQPAVFSFEDLGRCFEWPGDDIMLTNIYCCRHLGGRVYLNKSHAALALQPLLGHFDFIYSVPEAWLSVPFTFLGQSTEGLIVTVYLPMMMCKGIVAEGGASVTFANRSELSWWPTPRILSYFDVEIPSTVGVAKANETLLWGKKQTAEEPLHHHRSKIFPSSSADGFHAAVRRHLQSELEGLDLTAPLSVKKLLRAGLDEKNNPDAVNLRESYGPS
ncbi:hypothetical protein IW261DRAFT_1674577 [Armillaria novae-zelandiae]|uniref:Uncharacterized protein n=1 Tax=Armillaria novae-zelandiae TaxID=153914 RepID=A0AA39PGZ5_9AGAR|nr:hypothetical protein IW261DRAFT_1674577 [Armillaria novae-zelandiae]